jgi:hypothetical protein
MKANKTMVALAKILKDASILRAAEVEADKRFWDKRIAAAAKGKPMAFNLVRTF